MNQTGILPQIDILAPVHLILDRPVSPFTGQKPGRCGLIWREAGDRIAHRPVHGSMLPPGALDAQHLGMPRPVQIPGQCIYPVRSVDAASTRPCQSRRAMSTGATVSSAFPRSVPVGAKIGSWASTIPVS